MNAIEILTETMFRFGNVLNDTNPGFQPFGFAGGIYDPETGLVRYGSRDYDARVGRWTSKESVIVYSAEINAYGYSIDDPVNYLDINGKDAILHGSQGFIDAFNKALDRIGKTVRGKQLLRELDNLPDYHVYPSSSTLCHGMHTEIGGVGGAICWDPCWEFPFRTFGGKEAKGSPPRSLAHEMGHAAGYDDWGNIMINENPISSEWGESWRILTFFDLFNSTERHDYYINQ